MPTAAHFFYIPGILLLGIVIGWILGSRAAADAYAAQLRRSNPKSQIPKPKSQDANPES
jgi:Tfp pilus assembly protein PilF